MRKFILVSFLLAVSLPAMAEDWDSDGVPDDGTYDATVTTSSGSYTVPVEVENGEVSEVHWPNGGEMNVYGGNIDEGEATGYNSRGDYISIEIDEQFSVCAMTSRLHNITKLVCITLVLFLTACQGRYVSLNNTMNACGFKNGPYTEFHECMKRKIGTPNTSNPNDYYAKTNKDILAVMQDHSSLLKKKKIYSFLFKP